MAFDLNTAAPVASGGFDLSTAKPASNNGAKAPSEVPTGRRSYSISEVPGQMVQNVGPSASKFYGGLVQAITNPVQTITGLLDAGAGALRNALPEGVVNFIDQFDTNPEATKRAVETANAIGGMYKDRYGSYESIKRTFAEDPVGASADLSTLLTGGATATSKLPAVSGALSKAATVTNPLAPVGFAIDVAKQPIKAVGRLGEAAFNPKNALYLRAAEGKGPEIVNALRNAPEIVPGSVPTAAQAAANTGVVGFQKVGKSSAGVLETQYKGRELEQAAAAKAAVQSVGKTPDDIAALEVQRQASTSPIYKKADETLSKVDADLVALMNRPSMDQVMSRAARLAAEKGMPFQIGKTTPEVRTPSSLVDEMGTPLGETVTPAQFATLPGTSIHFVKQAFDDLVKDPSTFGIGASEARAIGNTRGEFLKWAEQTEKNPAYKQARETFSKMSEPIDQMKVGQFLESKLTPALGEDTAKLRAQGYATALEQAPGTIKKATGETRFNTLEEMFKSDPEALKTLYAIRDDLARQAKSERLMKGGVKQEFDVNRVTQAIAGENALPNMINNITTIANTVWRNLRGRVNQETAVEIATEMLFPGKAADALEKALKQQANRQAVTQAINAPFKAVYASPASVNMLSPQQQQQNQNALAK
jgi:hypothetical protein